MATRVEFATTAVANLFAGTATSGGTPLSIVGTASVGDLIIIGGLSENTNRDWVSFAGTGATTYAPLTGGNPRANAGCAQLFWGVAADANGGKGLVGTISGASSDSALICVWRFTGLDTTQAGLTQNQSTQDPGTPNVSGNVTPANATGCTFTVQLRTGSTWTDDGNFTEETTGSDRYYVAYRNNAPASAFQLSNTEAGGAQFSVTRIGAFEGPAAGGGSGILVGGTLTGGILLGVLA